MTYLLDTDICVYILNERPARVIERFRKVNIRNIGVSSITVAELLHGAEKSGLSGRNRRAIAQFIASLNVFAFGEDAATSYVPVRANLERQGTPIGPLDTLIAAHALSMDATLITNNTREFERVQRLRLENWAEA